MNKSESIKSRTRKYFIFILFFFSVIQTGISKNILIVYDGEKERSEAYLSARYTQNLLEHFLVREISLVNSSEYTGGMTENKNCVFVIFEEGDVSFPDILLKDLLETEANIVWLHSHFDRLLEISKNKWGISFVRTENRSDWKILYKDQDFLKEDPWLNVIRIEEGREVRVLANIENTEGKRYPYVLNSGNLWYFADAPFSYLLEGGRFLILADLLHDIMGEFHLSDKKALVRIEDVHPESNPRNLRRIARYLHKKKVPFQISLVPIFKDSDNQNEVFLSQRPELVEALKYAVSKNGAIIMHGVTHQHRGETGDDYEFWDDISGKPIRLSSPDWIDQKIKRGLSECHKNGIYPVSWETPHYSAGQSDYRIFAKYFSTFYDRVMATELSSSQQILPYSIKLREIDVTVIPENLGYMSLEDPNPAQIIENARNMLVVRDGLASFFFHPFISIEHLKRAVKHMTKMGWTFISIKDFDCQVKTDTHLVSSSGRVGEIRLNDQYLHSFVINRKGKIEKEEISKQRLTGLVAKGVDVPPGSLFVVEASESLPELEEGGSIASAKKLARKMLKRERDEALLNIVKILVVLTETSSQEDDFDQKSFISVLNVFGFHPVTVRLSDIKRFTLETFDLVVVPNPAARVLDEGDIRSLLEFVEKGGNLITDGKTLLAERLGIGFEERNVLTSEVRELTLPAQILSWSPAVSLIPCFAKDVQVLVKDAWRDYPLAFIKSFHKGRILFFNALFDPWTPYGISRYPYFPHYLRNSLGIPFNVRRNNLEFYFDPGPRQNTSWEKLVKRWSASGVKIVYLAAWHFYEDYQFDYDYFIQLCHDHGIAAYAWFEFPQVSPLFWDKHPDWREKTATGKDGKTHWRYLINLSNTEAKEEVRKFMRKILMDFDWDGVNLAELNYDTNLGAQDPYNFTPMNEDVRKAFREDEGFDPFLLFDTSSSYYWKQNRDAYNKFLAFRTETIKSLHVFFLEEIERIKKKKKIDMEVIVTAMDSLNHPEIIEECGIDILDIIALMDQYPFILQVQDPSRSWMKSPTRYREYYETYTPHIKDPARLMFDINIIALRDISSSHLASKILSGTELATTVYYAAGPSGRVGIYSEYTIYPFDMDILSYAMASDVELLEKKDGYQITAKTPFVLSYSNPEFYPYMNKEKWPFFRTTGIAIPSGKNFLSFKKTSMFNFQKLNTRFFLEGDIKDLKASGTTYSMMYESSIPVSFTYSRPVNWIEVDSQPIDFVSRKLGVVLPKGKHELLVSTGSQTFQVIDKAGYVSSSLFYILGFFSMVFLAVLYLYSRVKR
ncbi:MAG: DUF2334 domain-containing protein [Candidatus Aminicenantes bacterium]|nr:DUF2334 domain-containing protein [Candidatus Aminicenantes bacterium]